MKGPARRRRTYLALVFALIGACTSQPPTPTSSPSSPAPPVGPAVTALPGLSPAPSPSASAPASPATSPAQESTRPATSLSPSVGAAEILVTPHLADPAASSAVMSAGGGTLSAVGTEGTHYTLTIPPDALLDPVNVTLTPVQSIDGSPFSGGLLGGVQLEPDGLVLGAGATLLVQPNAPVAPPPNMEIVAFGYHGSGGAMHLAPDTHDAAGVTLVLHTFSGHLVGQGTPAEISKAAAATPADLGDSLEAARRTDVLALSLEKAMQQLLALVQEQTSVAAPVPKQLLSLENALEDMAAIVEARGLGAQFEEQLTESWDLIVTAWRSYVDRLRQDCATLTQPTAILYILFTWDHLNGLLGHPYVKGVPGGVLDQVKACVRFALDLNSTIQDTGTYPGIKLDVHTQGTSTPILEFVGWDARSLTVKIAGSDKLTFLLKTGTLTGIRGVCAAQPLTPPDGLVSAAAEIGLDWGGSPEVPVVTLVVRRVSVRIPQTLDKLKFRCKGGGSNVAGFFARFSTSFAYHRGGRPYSTLTIKPWDPDTYPIVGEYLHPDVTIPIVARVWMSTESAKFYVTHLPN